MEGFWVEVDGYKYYFGTRFRRDKFENEREWERQRQTQMWKRRNGFDLDFGLFWDFNFYAKIETLNFHIITPTGEEYKCPAEIQFYTLLTTPSKSNG